MTYADGWARGVMDMVRNREFDAAASICFGVLDRQINGLESRMKSRDYLSDTDQMLLAHLKDLRSEMELKLWGPEEDGSEHRTASERLGGTTGD